MIGDRTRLVNGFLKDEEFRKEVLGKLKEAYPKLADNLVSKTDKEKIEAILDFAYEYRSQGKCFFFYNECTIQKYKPEVCTDTDCLNLINFKEKNGIK
jgi:hypothetical protein